jgi:hypothetical protein
MEKGEFIDIMMQNRFEMHRRSSLLGPPGEAEGEPYFITTLMRLWGLVLSKVTDLIQVMTRLMLAGVTFIIEVLLDNKTAEAGATCAVYYYFVL